MGQGGKHVRDTQVRTGPPKSTMNGMMSWLLRLKVS